MKKFYEILGLNEDATLEEVNDAFTRISAELYHARKDGKISRAEYVERYDAAELAHDSIIEAAKKKAAEAAMMADIEKAVQKKADELVEEGKKEQATGAVVTKGVPVDFDDQEKGKDTSVVIKDTGAQKSGKGWKIATGVLAVALAAVVALSAFKSCGNQNKNTGAYLTGRPAITDTITDTPDRTVTDQTETQTQTTTGTQETETPAQREEVQDYSGTEYVVDLGDVENDTLVRARATELVDQMNAAGIVNPATNVAYTVDEIFTLIKYSNGVYTPSSLEEIDVLHLEILNLFISPLNTDDYLYHVVFASGNDDFNSLLNSNPNHVGFAEAFTAYGQNGVYPLVQWMQQKRFQIYSSTNREEINAIYREVGQVMADLMKGNGCTITLTTGKEKEGITYTFTSEQVLANHSSALLITTEAQLIFANHYEIRNELNEVVDEVPQTWEVYNKFNSDGVDEFGNPIINPDIVTYDEINAWINNGCDYEWGIESVLIGGQTFGQRIQSDMEGMAQNNYYMNTENKTLGK